MFVKTKMSIYCKEQYLNNNKCVNTKIGRGIRFYDKYPGI